MKKRAGLIITVLALIVIAAWLYTERKDFVAGFRDGMESHRTR